MTENPKTKNANGTSKQAEDVAREAAQRGRKLFQASSVRHVVIRGANGKKLVDMNMVLAVVLGVIAFVFAWWLLPLVLVVGYLAKLRVEIIREVSDDDKVIDIADV